MSDKRFEDLSTKKQKEITDKAKEVADAITGEDEDAGREAVQEYQEDIKKSWQAEKEKERTELNKEKSIEGYKNYLAKMLRERMETVYAPEGYEFATAATDKGVAVAISTPDGKHYARGFAPVYDFEYDHNACETLMLQAENTIMRHHATLLENEQRQDQRKTEE